MQGKPSSGRKLERYGQWPVNFGAPALLTRIFVCLAVAAANLFALPAAPAGATPAQTQNGGTHSTTASTSISQSFDAPNVESNLIVVSATYSTATTMSCADTAGNSYATVQVKYNTTADRSIGTCYAANIKASDTNTVTVTFGAAVYNRGIVINEFSGVRAVQPIDVVSGNTGNASAGTDSITSGSATTTADGDLIYGASAAWSATVRAGTNFDQHFEETNWLASETMTQTAAGAIAATASPDATSQYAANLVAFKASTPAAYDAAEVLGQYDSTGAQSFTNPFAQGQTGFNTAKAAVLDPTSKTMFVSDSGNNRVLAYHMNTSTKLPDAEPFAALGQSTLTGTSAGTTATTMSAPAGLAVDTARRLLFVAGAGNARVLVFDITSVTTGQPAIKVLGQTNFTTGSSGNGQAGMTTPSGVAYNSTTQRLFVSDSALHRVLVYNTATIINGMNATYVVGQPNFTTYTTGNGAAKMNTPNGIALDTSRNFLAVADTTNNRVTLFNTASLATGMSATYEFGPTGFGASGSGTTQAKLKGPSGVSFDASRGRLYIADNTNNRVIVQDVSGAIANTQPALYVIGQTGFGVSGAATTVNGLSGPVGVYYDSTNDRINVASAGNNRVITFDGAMSANTPRAVGLLGHLDSNGIANYTSAIASGADVTSWGLNNPGTTAVDTVNHRLFIADASNNRVLVHTLDSTNRLVDRTADYVLGQSSFTTNGSGVTQSTLNAPAVVKFDSTNNRLYVSDTGNNRILIFNTSSITNGMNASNVLGQPDFLTGTTGLTQAKLNGPYGMFFDSTNNRLFVSDLWNNRVMIWNTSSLSNGANAVNVLGQSNFTSNSQGTTSTTMGYPEAIAFDSGTNKLFVGDDWNTRVLVYNAASISDGQAAINVIGQPDLTSSSGGLSSTKFGGGIAGFAIDTTSHRLFATDEINNRLLQFDVSSISNGQAAVRVYGQPDFNTKAAATSRDGLSGPKRIAYDPSTDRLFVSDTNNNRIKIYEVGTKITTASFSNTSTGSTYSQQLAASNTIGTTTYSLSAGALPGGLTLSTEGLVSGSVTASAGTYNFTVTASDNAGPWGTFTDAKAFSIVVATGVAYKASEVIGQYNSDGSQSFTNHFREGQTGFNQTSRSDYDPATQTLFAADYGNNRVLAYHVNTDTNTPDAVPYAALGQPDLYTYSSGTTATTMNGPVGVNVDRNHRRLYITEYLNKRVSVFDISHGATTGMSASWVLGKSTLTATTGDNGQAGMTSPAASAFDQRNSYLYVPDYTLNRVLVFDTSNLANGMNASYVLGQGNFTTYTPGLTSTTMNAPEGASLDTHRNLLFVSDVNNSRVLVFGIGSLSNGKAASNVIGQGNMTSNGPATTQAGLSLPTDVAVDEARSRLYVADASNHRVEVFDISSISNGMNAIYVMGQPDYTSNGSDTDPKGFADPEAIEYIADIDRVVVADLWNNRDLFFDGAFAADNPDAVTIVGALADWRDGDFWSGVQTGDESTNWGIDSSYKTVLDSVHHRLFVSDYNDNQIRVYYLDSNNRMRDIYAWNVIGQQYFWDTTPRTTQDGLSGPADMAYDPVNNRLYVADSGNKRVLVWDTTWIWDAMNASNVLGQPDFTTNSAGTSQSKLSDVWGLALDSAGQRLFVGDDANNRVLVWDVSSLSDGMNASKVLGQANFTSSGSGLSNSALNAPTSGAYDASSNRYYVTDQGNARVMVYNASTITNGMAASYVLGQPDFTTATPGLSASKMQINPFGLAVDGSNHRLWVSDRTNNRVLQFDTTSLANGQSATRVYGQADYTSNTPTTSQSGLSVPLGLDYDSGNDRLFVADSANSRVVIYDMNTRVTTTSLPSTQPDWWYWTQVSASNPNGNTTFAVTGGALPAGLSLGTDGVISGNVNDSAGNYTFTVQATTDSGYWGTFSNSKSLTIAVSSGLYMPSDVIGQYDGTGHDSSDTGTPNPNGYLWQGQVGFAYTSGVAFDTGTNTMFASDVGGNRVLAYHVNPSTHQPETQPFAVLGQSDLNSSTSAASASRMWSPAGVAVDSARHLLYVSDRDNNRVLVFDVSDVSTGEDAVHVIGKSNFTTIGATSGQNGMKWPYQPSFDPRTGYLYVPDDGLQRVTVYDTNNLADGMDAKFVLGQPDFQTTTTGITASKMDTPECTGLDLSTNRLAVCDSANNRVLTFDIASLSNGMAASHVLGQANMTSNGSNITQSGLNWPMGATFDSARQRIYVSDAGNRVLMYDASALSDGMNATYVIGQTTFTGSGNGTSDTDLHGVVAVNFDPQSDRLYASDADNARLMVYDGGFAATNPSPVSAIGHTADDGTVNYWSNTWGGYDVTSWGLSQGSISVVDSVHHRLFIADDDNNRVLVHDLDGDNHMIDRFADNVLGQPDMYSNGTDLSQSGMDHPHALAYQASTDRLFVYDTNNHRVLVFDASSISDGMNASYVLGQPNFTTNTAGVTQAKLDGGYGLAIDDAHTRLFVADASNNRVMVWNIATLSNGKNAAKVLGQPDFTTNDPNLSSTGFNWNTRVTYDPAANRVYVSDENNHRIMVFDVTTITNGEAAVNVLGQSDFTSSDTGTSDTLIGTPIGTAIDSTNQQLFVADTDNHRILQYDVSSITNGEAATRVYGQSNFDDGGSSWDQGRFDIDYDVSYDDSTNRLYVGDWNLSRIQVYDVGTKILTASLDDGMRSSDYWAQITVSNPNGTTTYAVSGGALPNGLSLSTDGYITGTATTEGVFNFTITATTDAGSHGTFVDSKALSITIGAGGYSASEEIGQYNGKGEQDFDKAFIDGQSGFDKPAGVVTDAATSTMYVSDTQNHRVLAYHLDPDTHVADTKPFAVLGQPDLWTFDSGASATQMDSPEGLAIDPVRHWLYVSEFGNNRVLVFDVSSQIEDGQAAIHVLGQGNFDGSTERAGANGMAGAWGIALDTNTDYLYVTDQINNRVLVFDTTNLTDGMDATYVLGQPDFTSTGDNTSATTFWSPAGVAIDATRDLLFVAEWGNSRVVAFDTSNLATGMAASYVLGQPNFTVSGSNPTQSGLNGLEGVSVDEARGRLYVADDWAHRVVVFDTNSLSNGMNATYVIGQPDFTSDGSDWGPKRFSKPSWVYYDSSTDRVVVTDEENHRLMVFDGAFAADNPDELDMIGHEGNDSPLYYRNTTDADDPTSWTFEGLGGSTVDTVHHRLFVADCYAHRVMVYNLDANGRMTSRNADNVLGQADFQMTGGSASQNDMQCPSNVAYDSVNDRLYVAEAYNHRVSVYNTFNLYDYKPADYVLGEPDFTTVNSAATQSSVDEIWNVALDVAGQRLFAADPNNNRILVWDVSSLSNGKNAAYVLGQPDFTSNTAGTTSSIMSSPEGLAYDPTTNNLYVGDDSNHRILVFNVSTISNGMAATHVIGQTDFTSNVSDLSASNFGGSMQALALDVANHRLFATDESNARVLQFDVSTVTDGESAVRVYGQSNFTSSDQHLGRDGMVTPSRLSYDPMTDRIFVSDDSARRIQIFDVGTKITTDSLPTGNQGTGYWAQVEVSNPNYATTYTVTSGSLPAGLSMSADGTITGTPTTAGTANFTVTATTDTGSNGTFVDAKALSILIYSPAYLATEEVGQYDANGAQSFTNSWRHGQSGFSQPGDTAFDASTNTLFVADEYNNRVVAFAVDPATHLPANQPYAVIGQWDMKGQDVANTPEGMNDPADVTLDSARHLLFVSEWEGRRVRVYDVSTVTSTPQPVAVLGKANATATSGNDGQAGTGKVWGSAFDPNTNYLYVSDYDNNRVLVFDTTSLSDGINAKYVIGQPNFNTYTDDTRSMKLSHPGGLTIDPTRNILFVADRGGNRVVTFDTSALASGMAATHVLGQSNFTASGSAVTQAGLLSPSGVAVDTARARLYVAQDFANRVSVYDYASITDGENATYVMGQPDFTSSSSGTNNASFDTAQGVTYDSTADRIYIADNLNDRVLVFDGAFASNQPSALAGIGHLTNGGTFDYSSSYTNADDPTDWGLNSPEGIAIDGVHHRMFVGDSQNNRVLVHNLDTSNHLIDRNADYVLGQPDFNSTAPGLSQSQTGNVTDVAYDASSNMLYVGDGPNARILVYDVSTISNGMNAAYVLGQNNFTNGFAGLANDKLGTWMWGIEADPVHHRLFVSDSDNARVLVWDTSTLSNGKAASSVIGQIDMNSGSQGTDANFLEKPEGLAYDTVNDRLYVGDDYAARVLMFDASSITNGMSASKVLGHSAFIDYGSGISATQFGDFISGLAIDSTNQQLFVADYNNNRVVQFDVSSITNGEAATRVYGQPDFTTGTGATSRSGMSLSDNLAYDDTSKQLWVTGESAHRVVVYDVGTKITTNALPNGAHNIAYSQQLTSSNPNGTTTFAVTSGSLPTGLSLSSSGLISGTVTSWGSTFNFTVTATDDAGTHGTFTDAKAMSIVVNDAPIAPVNLQQTKTNTNPIPGTTLHNWDATLEGWVTFAPGAGVYQSGAYARSGTGSMAVSIPDDPANFYGASITDSVNATRDLSANGTQFSTWVYLPSGTPGTNWIAQIGVTGSDDNLNWGSQIILTPGAWNLVNYTPTNELLHSMKSIGMWLANDNEDTTGTNTLYVDDFQQGSGIWTDESSVRFTASLADTDPADTDQLCIEAKPINTAFTNTEDSCGTGVAYSASPVTGTNTLSSLTNGEQYHWQARTKDLAGLYSSWVQYGGNQDTTTASPDFGIDMWAPSTPLVYDGTTNGVDINYNNGELDRLSANWSANDIASGIAYYSWSIGTSAGATDVVGWTTTSNTSVTKTGLSLRTGQLYFFNVTATDVAGRVTAVASSNGQAVAPTLTFQTSTNSIDFGNLSAVNSYDSSRTLTLTTSTNAYSGYVVRQSAAGPFTDGTHNIPDYSGTYAAPTTWSGTGFGYTSNDANVQSSGDLFAGATKYAGLGSAPGDIVADHTTNVAGTPIANETFDVTYRVKVDATTPAGAYATTITLSATALF